MSSPHQPPDDWLAPAYGGHHPDVPPADTGGWPPPSPHPLPPPGGWGPPPASPPRNTTLIALVVTFSVITAAVLGIGWARWGMPADPYGDGSQGTRTPGAVTTPTVAPSSGPVPLRNPPPPPRSARSAADPVTGEWALPTWGWDELPAVGAGADQDWRALQGEPLADLAPPELTGCDAPATVDDEESYEKAVRRQWHCVHEAWLPILTDLGWPTNEPKTEFFAGAGGRSPCGYVEAPAFYCPLGEGTAHFGGDDMEVAMYWDLTINETVNHEYAHHIQSLAGIMEAAEYVTWTGDIDRRLELQASCLASAMTIHNVAAGFDQYRWEDWRDSMYNSIPDDEHGSIESLLYWGTRGLYAETLGDCNTWSVAPERVG